MIAINRAERSLIVAGLYLLMLFVSIIAMWWVMLTGGNPMTVRSAISVDAGGVPRTRFVSGEFVGIRREICSTKNLGALASPGLRNRSGILVPLPIAIVAVRSGCSMYNYGFIVPDLPSGSYKFGSVVQYQTSLVGRDEHALFDTVIIEVNP